MKKEEKEREREITRQRVALYAYENIQVSIKTRDLWILGCRARNTIFPLKIYVFIHVRGSREWRTLVDRGRLRAGSLFAFSPLLTSYSRAYFLRQPSRIVNVNAHFFHTLPPITTERKKRIAMREKFDSSSILNKRICERTIIY